MEKTPRDSEQLFTMGCCVGPVIPTQWWSAAWPPGSSGLRACYKRIVLLARADLITIETGIACVASRCQQPLACWCPGAPPPDLQQVHRQSSARWRNARQRSVRYMRITPAGAAQVGGVSRVVRPSELGHDLALTDAYYATRRNYPRVAALWSGEWMQENAHTSGGRFDAVIRTPSGPIMVEVIGESYTLDDLLEMHEECASQEWRYQLW